MAQQKAKKESIAYPVVFMAILAIITTSLLSAIHFFTYDTIAQNEKFVFNSSLIKAAGYLDEKNPLEAEEFIQISAVENRIDEEDYIIFEQNGKKSLVVIHQESGLWGTIRAAVGFSIENMTISGIEFIQQSETPGLGARITQEWFKSSVRGKNFPVGTGEDVPSQKRIDAVTGATVTTNAVVNLINNSHKKAQDIISKREQ